MDIPDAVKALERVTLGHENDPPIIVRFLHKDQTWKYVEVRPITGRRIKRPGPDHARHYGAARNLISPPTLRGVLPGSLQCHQRD